MTKLSLVRTRSYRSLRSFINSLKTKTQSLSPSSIGSSCTTLTTKRPGVNQALRKSVICIKSRCDSKSVYLRERNFFARQRNRHYQYLSKVLSKQVMIRQPKEKILFPNYFISFDNSTCRDVGSISNLGGHEILRALFTLRKRGHFLQIKGHFYVYCKILGARPQCPWFLSL